MSTPWLLVVYCLLIVLASVTGGWLPSWVRMSHLRTQLLMSFVAGLMLGIATLHLLPHSLGSLGSTDRVGVALLVGVLVMFLLLRVFHVHSHGDSSIVHAPPVPGEAGGESGSACGHDHAHGHTHAHGASHSHDHGAGPAGDGPSVTGQRSLNWLGMLFGLGLHTIMDGVALGASVVADASHGAWMGLAGLGTFLAVALHKPLDAFAIGSVMASGGWSPTQRTVVNFAFSLCCPIGALLFFYGVMWMGAGEQLLGYGLALSAGFFICIALADLLPEVQFHDHDRGKLTAALMLGIALAVGIENLPGHSHDHAGHGHAGHGHAGHGHADHGHDHGHDHGTSSDAMTSGSVGGGEAAATPGQRFRDRLAGEHRH